MQTNRHGEGTVIRNNKASGHDKEYNTNVSVNE